MSGFKILKVFKTLSEIHLSFIFMDFSLLL